MLSGIGPTDELRKSRIPVIKDLQVGKNLQDHVSFIGFVATLTNETSTLKNLTEIQSDAQSYLYRTHDANPLSSFGPVSCVAQLRTKFEPRERVSDLELSFLGLGLSVRTREYYQNLHFSMKKSSTSI